MIDTDLLREAFRADAKLAGRPPADPYESVLARRQKSDRRRLAVLAAGLAVALVAVAIPVGISLLGGRDSQVVSPPSAPPADIFAEPTRGSLAVDTGFVEAVRQLTWAVPGIEAVPMYPDAPVESRHVVFAGDVAAGRWALVVGENTAQLTGDAADPDLQTDLGTLGDLAAVWFVGPAGASPEQMRAANLPHGINPDLPASLYDGTTGALVVVAAPGDFIEVSVRPEVAADASVTRTFVDTETSDGVAVMALGPRPAASFGPAAVQYRVTRGGVVVADQPPDGYAPPDGSAQPVLNLEYLRPRDQASPVAEHAAEDIAAGILGEYGLDPDEVELLVHYVGPVPGSGGLPAGLSIVTATFPSGAVLIRADWRQPLDATPGPDEVVSYGGGWCVNQVFAAGVPADQWALAMRCDVLSGGEDADPESSLIVVVPTGISAASVTAVADDGETAILLSAEARASGVVIVPFPEGATGVVIQTTDGTNLEPVPISSQ